jgi:hypothetical protein
VIQSHYGFENSTVSLRPGQAATQLATRGVTSGPRRSVSYAASWSRAPSAVGRGGEEAEAEEEETGGSH